MPENNCTMDVPHHSHSHEKKKDWKSYAGEFLMLFLAVFCGFIAENAREYFADKEKEHQYIHSMVTDLKKDTAEFRLAIRKNQKIIKKIDTLLIYLKMPASDSVNKKIYQYSTFVSIYVLFGGSNGTMTQLKNAGGLRLIKDTAAVDRITEYDQANAELKEQGVAYAKACLDMLSFLSEIMDFSANAQGASAVYHMDRNPSLMRKFYNKCYIQKQLIVVYCSILELQKKEAVTDINFLSTHYHIGE